VAGEPISVYAGDAKLTKPYQSIAKVMNAAAKGGVKK
jgi:hypothetical protein